MLGTVMITSLCNLGQLSSYGVRLLVSSPISSVGIETHVVCIHGRCQVREQRCALRLLLSFVTCHHRYFCVKDSCDVLFCFIVFDTIIIVIMIIMHVVVVVFMPKAHT